jgi:riboflavin synthase
MFTGLIAHLGKVRELVPDPRGGMTLRVFAPTLAVQDTAVKDSICVSGVCLTLTGRDGDLLAFDVVPETLQRSNLGALRAGDPVNLELSLRVGDRLGGHLVYGHVDSAAAIRTRAAEGQGARIAVELPDALARFVVEKAFVAVDGVSVTVAAVRDGRFEIAVIPETAARTTLGSKAVGALLNIEVDPVARYVLGAADAYAAPAEVSSEELAWAYEI